VLVRLCGQCQCCETFQSGWLAPRYTTTQWSPELIKLLRQVTRTLHRKAKMTWGRPIGYCCHMDLMDTSLADAVIRPQWSPNILVGQCRNTAPTNFNVYSLANAATWPPTKFNVYSFDNAATRPRHRPSFPLANAVTRPPRSFISSIGQCRNTAPTESIRLVGRRRNVAPTEFYAPLADAAMRLRWSSSSCWLTPQYGTNRFLRPVGWRHNTAPTELHIFPLVDT